jgi:hypothetical protein
MRSPRPTLNAPRSDRRAGARYHAAGFRVGDGLTLRKSGKLGIVGEIKSNGIGNCRTRHWQSSPAKTFVVARRIVECQALLPLERYDRAIALRLASPVFPWRSRSPVRP